MKKMQPILLLVLLLCITSCDKQMNRLRQKNLNGVHVALLASSMQEERAKNTWPEGIYRSYPTNDDALDALNKGEVDAAYLDELVMFNKNYQKSQFDVAFIDNDHMPIAGALRKDDTELVEKFATFLREIKSDGEYVRMKNRWTMTDRIDTITPPVIHEYNKVPKLFTLNVGIIGEMRPYSIRNKGQWTGLENELWARFAEHIGYKITYSVYNFDDLIPALLEHKIDVIAAAMTVTEERELQVIFTEPYAYSCSVCLTKK